MTHPICTRCRHYAEIDGFPTCLAMGRILPDGDFTTTTECAGRLFRRRRWWWPF